MVDGIDGENRRAIGHLDLVEEIGSRTSGVSAIERGAYALVRGWAIDTDRRQPLDRVTISIGDGAPVRANIGLPRPDVADQFGPSSFASGFVAAVPVTAAVGRQQLRLNAHSGGEGLPCDLAFDVSVARATHPFRGLTEEIGLWGFAIDGVFADDGNRVEYDGSCAIIPLGVQVAIRLWAIDLGTRSLPAQIVARSGGIYLAVVGGLFRHDAALAMGLPDANRCGFAIPVAPSVIGNEVVEVFAVSKAGTFTLIGEVSLRRPKALTLEALPASAQLRGAIDGAAIDAVPIEVAQSFTLANNQKLTIRGWVIDEIGPRASGGVFARSDGAQMFEASFAASRKDIEILLESPGLLPRAFAIAIPGAALGCGKHHLSIYGLSARRDGLSKIGEPISIVVSQA